MEATDFDGKLADADLVITGEGRIDAQTAFGKTALGVAQRGGRGRRAVHRRRRRRRARGDRRARRRSAPSSSRSSEQPQIVEEAMAAGAAPVERCGERIAAPRLVASWPSDDRADSTPARPPAGSPKPQAAEATRKPDPIVAWTRRLDRYRPGLVDFTLDGSPASTATRVWDRRLDPTSELILTILTQNTADIERRGRVRAAPRGLPVGASRRSTTTRARAGAARGLPDGAPPDWARVECAPIEELIDVIRPGGLATQKAPRIQASLRKIREERGDYSLEFLGDMAALEARDWLTGDQRHRQEDRVGRAAVLLRPAADARSTATSSGSSKRVGLLPPKALDGPGPRHVPRAARSRTGRTRATST